MHRHSAKHKLQTNAYDSQLIETILTWLRRGILLIAIIMPFHAFLSVYLGSLLGHQSLIQSWKDIIITFMLVGAGALALCYREYRQILRKPLNLAIIGFAILSFGISLINHEFGSRQFWYGAKTDLEFLVLFVIAQLANHKQLEKQLTQIIIITTGIVAVFGSLQVIVLDKAFLTHFGYGAATLLPYHLVDPAVPLSIRIMSTLAGPNQLGSFLILPICVMLFLLIKKRHYWLSLPLMTSLFVLFHSYSRSAWIGALVAIIVTGLFCLPPKIAALTASLIVATALLLLTQLGRLQNKYPKLEYYLLHGQSTGSVFQSSDQGHVAGFKRGASAIAQNPLGRGLGTAGPASYQSQSSLITENYYLQLGIEVGLIGLVLFLVINGFLATALMDSRSLNTLAIPCLAALFGLGVVNLFLHAWADSSTALVFWTIAGVAIATPKSAHNA